MDQTTRRTLFFVVVLVVFVVMMLRYYWRFSLFFGGEDLSLYTPEHFTLPDEFSTEHDKHVKIGSRKAKQKSVVICSLLRDAEDKIDDLKKRVEKMGELFRSYRVLIVENDSSDRTREKLLEWAAENPRVTILGCGENVRKCELKLPKTEGHSVYHKRIQKMSKLRNIYLDYISSSNLASADYVIVWDMDILGSVYLDGVLNSLGYLEENSNMQAMCAYGIYSWGPFTVYYDTYAHQEEGDEFNIELKYPLDMYNGLFTRYARGEPPKKVKSCFSGFTIYRASDLSGARYGQPDETNLRCEHSMLHDSLSGVYMNPSMIHLVLRND